MSLDSFEGWDPGHEFSIEELTDGAPRCTDAGNADAFMARHGAGFRWVVQWAAWVAWDGQRWALDGAREHLTRAILLSAREDYALTKLAMVPVEEALRVARLKGPKSEETDRLERSLAQLTALSKWHTGSQNAGKIVSCEGLLRAHLTIGHTDLDAHPMLFAVSNVTVDLSTGEIKEHDPRDLLTKMAPVEWDDEATCPTWDRFLRQAMGGDMRLVLYLQRLVGYALTALTREHVLLFLYGDGSNGKSTFLRTIEALFGEYGCSAPPDLLMIHGAGQPHPTESVTLYGKRLAICAELGDQQRFDEAKTKRLTGGDAISARRMNENFWTFPPTHTLFLAGNHKPTIVGNDRGIWRRIRLIPWLVTIADSEADKALPEKLLRELPGILKWAVAGCLEWQRIGLVEPEVVLAATAEYREESDVLGQFLSQRCAIDSDGRITQLALRTYYEQWCKEAGHEPQGGRRLARRLKESGIVRTTVRDGGKVSDGWAGIRMLRNEELYARAEPSSDTVTS